mmetsp:Transcript_36594/g.62300  ORF Transcript_36594/g.62300 Transcript_36594/m.62300 type:complete len:224 (+) Transcript_36594:78-749(+)|eukprot:CAMPEP_0183732126 /NCGR_PEP_ID=MMETSP0737-20130205/37574_1 /TAXON_ID=385413 /ORGANISM="Thalassiosira miniscula, Strain CCMP1093" /LENGTH=223 /DNA_ID=CAMNT_0025965045 /DNA_START=169 /DNA_END=840 /DNA_ORIENTATION=-
MNNIVLTFDIETLGPDVGRHPLVAIGAVAHEFNRKTGQFHLLETLELHFNFEMEDADPRTLQWWQSDENKQAWEDLRANAVSLPDGAATLNEFILKWQCEAIEVRKSSYNILTDNAWYDETWISWLLCTHTQNGHALRKTNYPDYGKGGWMKIGNCIDVNQRVDALNDLGLSIGLSSKFRCSVPHDHTPVNDAIGIAEKWFFYLRETKELRKRITLQQSSNKS